MFRSLLMPRAKSCLTVVATALLMAGCATGPDGPDSNGPAPTQTVVAPTVTKPAVARRRRVTTKKTVAKPPKPQVRKMIPAKTDCKVKKNVVRWVLISGGCKNGFAHGSGVARSVDRQRRFSGGFVEGEFSGKGEYDWGNGVRYTGEFQRGKKHGNTLLYADNSSYVGEFKDNVYHGHGTYIGADKSRYIGQFRGGQFNGEGTYDWANGNRYVGEFVNNMMSGQGTFTWPIGEQYKGRFNNNEMTDEGIYTWPNGERYQGEFKNNKMNGEGVYRNVDGSTYAVEFKDGKRVKEEN